MKYAQIIKIQNNIRNNSDITSHTCQIYDVKSLSAWTSEKEAYRVDFGSNDKKKKKRNIGRIEDTGLEWNQFSQRRGKDLGQVLFVEEKKHWIFVYRKGGSDVNICDSLRNNGKQNYPKYSVRANCRIACCMDSALKVNCLQVQQQSNNIDCGGLCHCLCC